MRKKSSTTSKNRKLRKNSLDLGDVFVAAFVAAAGTELGKYLVAALIQIITNGSHYTLQAPLGSREGACFLWHH